MTDLQDPLPEGSFFYRRWYSYVLTASLIGLLAFTIWQISDSNELRRIALYECVLLFCISTYYMIAPSAEQVVKMLQTVKLSLGNLTARSDQAAPISQIDAEPDEFDGAPTSKGKTHG